MSSPRSGPSRKDSPARHLWTAVAVSAAVGMVAVGLVKVDAIPVSSGMRYLVVAGAAVVAFGIQTVTQELARRKKPLVWMVLTVLVGLVVLAVALVPYPSTKGSLVQQTYVASPSVSSAPADSPAPQDESAPPTSTILQEVVEPVVQQPEGATGTTSAVPPPRDDTAADAVRGVTVTRTGVATYRVSWENPSDPSIAGWIVSSYPQGAGSGSGHPVPDPDASFYDEDMDTWFQQFRYKLTEPIPRWKSVVAVQNLSPGCNKVPEGHSSAIHPTMRSVPVVSVDHGASRSWYLTSPWPCGSARPPGREVRR